MTDYVVIQTTTGARHDAQRIAAALIDQRLPACVQIGGPIESVYKWQGQQQTSEEWLVTIKTRVDRFPAAEAAILALHPYEQPEIIALPMSAINAGYARWIDQSLAGE